MSRSPPSQDGFGLFMLAFGMLNTFTCPGYRLAGKVVPRLSVKMQIPGDVSNHLAVT